MRCQGPVVGGWIDVLSKDLIQSSSCSIKRFGLMFEKLIKKKRPFSLKVVIAARHFRPIVLCYLNLKRTPVATKILNCLKWSKWLQVDNLPNFPSKVLATLFAVSSKLCDEKFELKINDVRWGTIVTSLEFLFIFQIHYLAYFCLRPSAKELLALLLLLLLLLLFFSICLIFSLKGI